ncbi:N-acyl amino acid synthase FeeM domain-containing protein [Sphingomonas elodea]|uniref:N-acyl amino acid synthase FeeM domain-containing protein n=1 Tax=Sphingomonas elodea TaxID=179878 RepID=UPI00026306C9|nr:hypothetical protein [Sphingomonas elodea]
MADSGSDRARASGLINRMYGWRGYGSEHVLPSGTQCTTFVAESGTEVVGTLSLTVDGPAGLAADRTFGDILDAIRQTPGASLCELAKFAFDTATPAKSRLAALFHSVLIFGSAEYGCSDLFIEVNPRHKAFYEASLGFRALTEPRINQSVMAPSYLLWLSVDAIRQNIERCQRGEPSGKHSLYPYFLSAEDEKRVAQHFRRPPAGIGELVSPVQQHLPGCSKATLV